MPIYLDEDMAGRDAAVIGFPHLLVCMGLLLKTDTALYGVHITNVEQTNQTVDGFAIYLHAQNVALANMQALYASANFKVRYAGVSGPSSDLGALWRVEMTRIAGKLGYRGPIFGFDTSVIAPQDGTYVEFHAQPANGTCRIFYKRNEKLVYDGASGAGTGTIVKIRDGVPQNHLGYVKTSAAIQPGSMMTEVNYANRLISGFIA